LPKALQLKRVTALEYSGSEQSGSEKRYASMCNNMLSTGRDSENEILLEVIATITRHASDLGPHEPVLGDSQSITLGCVAFEWTLRCFNSVLVGKM
jgi:hypothetical protein